MSSTFKSTLLGTALAAALALPVSAPAAPTVNTFAGNTQVTLSSEFVAALTTLGIAPSAEFPGSLVAGRATFPVDAGELDAGTAKGEIIHTGGLNLRRGGTTVTIATFTIDTTGTQPVLTGIVKANDSVVGRIPLFNLSLPALSLPIRPVQFPPPLAPQFGQVVIPGVGVTLTATAASALNEAFGVTAFAAGIPIGTAVANVLVYSPEDFAP
jgi:hypothetical protein